MTTLLPGGISLQEHFLHNWCVEVGNLNHNRQLEELKLRKCYNFLICTFYQATSQKATSYAHKTFRVLKFLNVITTVTSFE